MASCCFGFCLTVCPFPGPGVDGIGRPEIHHQETIPPPSPNSRAKRVLGRQLYLGLAIQKVAVVDRKTKSRSEQRRGGREGPIEVAVIGGGCASIAAAFELTRPELNGKYHVTVYQLGWRLGGQGASGRGPANRIERPGLATAP